MRRREFIPLLGGMVMWPLMASARQVARMPRVIQLAPADVPGQVESTRAGLRELGYVEGRNIRLEFRNAASNVDALPALAQEIVRDGGVDAILAISTPAALAAYKATQTRTSTAQPDGRIRAEAAAQIRRHTKRKRKPTTSRDLFK